VNVRDAALVVAIVTIMAVASSAGRAHRRGRARSARVVYVRSQHDHMELVTGGVALPMLLRAVRLPVVENASRRAPIRKL
jgi:hypothetical protein